MGEEMEGKKMDKLQRDLDTVDTYIEHARKMLGSARLQLACASAILDSLADGVEIDPAPGEWPFGRGGE